MKSKIIFSTFVFATLLLACSFNLEAKSKTRFGFSFGSGYTTVQPAYVASVAQPVYVYPAYSPYPVVYQTPVYQPVYVYPQRSTGFSFSWSNFWR